MMVSDFIDEMIGFLALTDEEANKHDITTTQRARETLEYYGGSREGYWNSEFMMQMNNAVKIAEIKYPADNWKILWIFDHSS